MTQGTPGANRETRLREDFESDGRMYPVQNDFCYPAGAGVMRYRSRGHETFIGANGAFEIRRPKSGTVELAKAGLDGQGVWS